MNMVTVRFWGLKSELGQGHCPQYGQSLREKERLKNHMQTVHENFGDVCFHLDKVSLTIPLIYA